MVEVRRGERSEPGKETAGSDDEGPNDGREYLTGEDVDHPKRRANEHLPKHGEHNGNPSYSWKKNQKGSSKLVFLV